jgi:hypothetical protein
MRHVLSLAYAALLLSSCATAYEVPAAVAGPIDSTFRAQGLSPRKIKFTGPVTLQVGGTGNTATTTAIAKAKAPVATAPAAVATDASKKTSGLPWWKISALGLAAGLVIGLYFRFR